MKPAPENCIVCGLVGASCVWNGMSILTCPHCGLGWRALFDLPDDYYTELNEGEVGIGEEKVASRFRNAQDRLISLKDFLPRSGVCDVGCGDGSFLSALRDGGYKECWGIEPSAYACRLASEKKLEVVRGDISDLSQSKQERAFRACTLFHVIEHVPDPLDVLQTLKDALPFGGILVIETPNADAALQKVTDHKNALIYPEHLFYWTEQSLRTALDQKGFKILKICRRSFDWQHAPIKASLIRLGLFSRDNSPSDKQAHPRSSTPKIKMLSNRNPLRELARTLLARLVHLLKRDDYLLVVAERP